jgi:hypothetical protein
VSAFVDGMAIASGAVVVVTGAAAIAAGVRARWRYTVGSRHALSRSLNGLAAGMPAERLESALGTCAIRRHATELKVQPYFQENAPTLRQLIFVTKHACIDAYVESELETVVAFCITVTDPRFAPDIARLTFGSLGRVRLGRTTFANSSISQTNNAGVYWWNGARDAGYAEAHYGANPGGYQHYVLAYLQTGVGNLAYDDVPSGEAGGVRCGLYAVEADQSAGDGPAADDWKWFRAKTTVNTLQVLGPEWCWTLNRPGIHGDITRLLRDPPRTALDRLRAWAESARLRRQIKRSGRTAA